MELIDYLEQSLDDEILSKIIRGTEDIIAGYIVRNYKANVAPEITKAYIREYIIKLPRQYELK